MSSSQKPLRVPVRRTNVLMASVIVVVLALLVGSGGLGGSLGQHISTVADVAHVTVAGALPSETTARPADAYL